MGEENRDEGEDLLFATMVIVSVGSIIYFNLAKLGIPYTVAMFIFGIVLGLLSLVMADWYDRFFVYFAEIPPRLLFHIFLPVLIFEGSYGVKPFALKTVFKHAVILATVGLIINTIIVAAAVRYFVYPEWSWYAAILLGSILSATDPVAVVTLLKDLGIDANITAVVDAEALMNDGTAIICFELLLPATLKGHMDGTAGSLFVDCLRLTVLAGVFGYVVGVVVLKLLRTCENNPLVSTLQTVSFAYMAYFVADEVLKTSGVLTLFTMGSYLAKNYPSMFPGSHASLMTSTWHFLVHTLNTVIFCLVGIVIARRSFDDFNFVVLGTMLFMYAVCVLARMFMITVLLPVMNFGSSWKLGWREVSLQVYGGLRGGVATILALMVADEDALPESMKKGFLHITCGIVVLTIVVNATTSANVVRRLDLQAKPKHRLEQMKFGLRHVNAVIQHALHEVKHDVLLRTANWMLVHEIVEGMANPYEEMTCIEEEDTQAFTAQVMRVFKTSVFHLRDNDRCTEDVLCTLFMLAQRHISSKTLSSITELNEHMEYPAHVRWLDRTVTFEWAKSQVLKSKKQHDTFFFGLLLAYGEALDRVEHIVPDYAKSAEQVAMVSAWLERERQEMSHLIQIFQEEKPQAAVAVFTAIAAAQVMKEAEEAIHKLHHHKGFAEFDTGALEAALHEAKHPITRLAAQLDPSTPAEMFALSPIGMGIGEMTLNILSRSWAVHKARAEQTVEIGRAVGVLVRGIASVVANHDAPLVPGSVWGAESHVVQGRKAPPVVATTDIEYITLEPESVKQWIGDDPLFAANVQFTAARSIAEDLLINICRFASLDEEHIGQLCRDGKLITAPHDGYSLPQGETDDEVTFYIRGADASGLISEGMAPFVVPRCASFLWKRGAILFRVEAGYARGRGGGHGHGTRGRTQSTINNSLLSAPSATAFIADPDAAALAGAAASEAEMRQMPSEAITYDPSKCATPVPYFNRAQLHLIVALEQLQHVAEDYTNHPNFHRRQAVVRAVDHTLQLLSRFCVNVFHCEEAVYRLGKVADWQAKQQAKHDALQALISDWMARRAKDDGLFFGEMLEAMTHFATEHFPEDARDLADAARVIGAEKLATLRNEMDFREIAEAAKPAAAAAAAAAAASGAPSAS